MFSVCICSLSMQHEQRMRRVTLSSAACPAVPYFLHYPINGTIFGEKVIEHKKKRCFDFLYSFCLQHFLFWEEFSEIL
jgi:hypothetical protein